MTDVLLSLQQAADELGVHYMTAYRYVRLGKLAAVKSGGTWEVSRTALKEFSTAGAGQPAPKSTKAWESQLETVLLAGDERAAWMVVESALASGHEPEAIYSHMLAPALRAIGRHWQDGTIDVADEHRASLTATLLVGRLSPRFNRRGRTRGSIVVAAPPDDFHALAVMMVSDLIRSRGYETIDLGGAVPAESLGLVVSCTDLLSAVAIVAFKPDNEPAIRASIATVRAVSDVPVFLGGHAVDGPNHARGLGATAYAEDVDDLLGVLDRNS